MTIVRCPATLLAMEYGAGWPRWLDPASMGLTAVVAQRREGPPSWLITEVAQRVARLEAMGWHLSTMVIVSNGQFDVDSGAVRSVLARKLLSRMSTGGGGCLTFTVDERLGGRASHGLTRLASALAEDATAGNVLLSVRVGQAPAISVNRVNVTSRIAQAS